MEMLKMTDNKYFLTSLMKQKFGMTKSSPLKFTEKDTLYTCFRKLADHIYKNGEWTQEDEIQAVDTMMRNWYGFSVGLEEVIKNHEYGSDRGEKATLAIVPISEEDQLLLKSEIKEKRGYTAVINDQISNKKGANARTVFVLLDPNNKSGTKHNRLYYYRHKKNNQNEKLFVTLGNMNRAIGYDKLQQDILREYDRKSVNQTNSILERRDLERYLEYLSDSRYSGKKSQNRFQKSSFGELSDEFLERLPRDESSRFIGVPLTEDVHDVRYFNWRDLTDNEESLNKLNLDKSPYILASDNGKRRRYLYPDDIQAYRKQNQLFDFVKGYIDATYDIMLQREYEKDIEKQTRASAWQTKKNINKETQEMMNQTNLKEHFQFIELDNDVDLQLFQQFENEMKRVYDILPQTNADFILRLRKLGNYHALGMYVPVLQTIAIDFRDDSDDIGGIGIQSFIHEYGHALDYTSQESGKMLSMEENFRPLISEYRRNITKHAIGTFVAKKAGYYGTPTEVFARAFEIYVSDLGLESSFIKSSDTYKTQIDYQLFNKSMREELIDFFNCRFPDLREKIGLLNKQNVSEKLKVPEQTALFNIIEIDMADNKKNEHPENKNHLEF